MAKVTVIITVEWPSRHGASPRAFGQALAAGPIPTCAPFPPRQ